jgi:hypothetical protein
MKMLRFLATLLVMASFPAWVMAQQAILQGGPWQPAHAPMYVPNGYSQPIVQDSGPAGGGGTNLGLSELLLTQRSPTNQYPANATGSGPFGTNLCDYDAPLTNTAGYHYFCVSPNINGVPTIVVGSGGAAAPTSLNFLINGITYPFPTSGGGSTITTVINNSALQALPTTTAPQIQRMSFATPGDSPALLYTASGSACSLNAGAGDNGWQVKSANNLCWIANFPASGGDARQWGCGPTYTAAVNTTCMQAAINATAALGTRLLIVGGPYPVNSLVAATAPYIVGAGGGQGIYNRTCTAGLRQATANIDVLTLQVGGTVDSLCIDQAAGIVNSSGHGLYSKNSNPIVAPTHFYNNQVNNACFGVGITADSATNPSAQNLEGVVSHNIALPASNNNCAAYVVGETSTGGNTGNLRFESNSVYCGDLNSTGLLILDSGGVYLNGNVFSYRCNIGTKIFPGNNQAVNFTQASNSVLGDSDGLYDLLIDTGAANSIMFSNTFVGSWASTGAGGSVHVRNTGASPNLGGLYFKAMTTFVPANQTAFDIGDTWTNVTLQDNSICAQASSPSGTGISIGGSVSQITVENNRIAVCDSFVGTGTLGTGVSLTSSSTNLGIITGNSFGSSAYPVTNPVAFGGGGSANYLHLIINNNWGIDDIIPSPVTAATTIPAGIYPNIFLTSSAPTTISNINGDVWNGRYIQLRNSSVNTLTFAVGGSGFAICNAMTLTQFQTATAFYNSGLGCWMLQGP